MAYGRIELRERLERYLAFLEENMRVQRAILFGSYVYGSPGRWSDIDLVILSPDFKGVPYPKRLEMLAMLAWRAGVGDIEALGFTPEEFEKASPASLLGEVRERGIVIYEAEEESEPGIP